MSNQLKRMLRVPPAVLRLCRGACASRFSSRLVILTYHRVLAERDEMLPDEPTRQEFERQMQVLAASFNVVDLGEAVSMLENRELPGRSVAVTFDDGYRNNFEQAMPILQKYGVPATFFVATGFLDDGCMWNDRVIEAIRACRSATLDLTENDLGLVRLESAGQRMAATSHVISKLKHLPFDERDNAVTAIVAKCGATSPRDMMMTREQVGELARNGFVIGGHTINHPILSRIGRADAQEEICAGKRELEEITDRAVELFAYPNGRRGVDYEPLHVDLVRAAGFRAAVSTHFGYADRNSPVLELPRAGIHRRSQTHYKVDVLSAFGIRQS